MLVEDIYVGKDMIVLSPVQAIILEVLLLNKGRVIKSKDLKDIVHCTSGTLSQNIKRLNKKLKDEIEIKNKKGFGYYI